MGCTLAQTCVVPCNCFALCLCIQQLKQLLIGKGAPVTYSQAELQIACYDMICGRDMTDSSKLHRAQHCGHVHIAVGCCHAHLPVLGAGHLQQLDLTSYLLNCSLPMSSLSHFTSLQTVQLSSNPDLRVCRQNTDLCFPHSAQCLTCWLHTKDPESTSLSSSSYVSSFGAALLVVY